MNLRGVITKARQLGYSTMPWTSCPICGEFIILGGEWEELRDILKPLYLEHERERNSILCAAHKSPAYLQAELAQRR